MCENRSADALRMGDFSMGGNRVRSSGCGKRVMPAVSTYRREVPSPHASYLGTLNCLQYSSYGVRWKIP